MEIIRKDNKSMTFSDIGIGDIFQYKDSFFMKIAPSSLHEFNAVDIVIGDMFKFSDDREVIFHKAKVIIED